MRPLVARLTTMTPAHPFPGPLLRAPEQLEPHNNLGYGTYGPQSSWYYLFSRLSDIGPRNTYLRTSGKGQREKCKMCMCGGLLSRGQS